MKSDLVIQRSAKKFPAAILLQLFLLIRLGIHAETGISATSTLMRLPKTPQQNQYYCGPASLQSILAYYGTEMLQQSIGREVKTTAVSGTPVSSMVAFLQAKGFKAEIRRGMTHFELRQKLDARHPLILMIQAWSGKAETDWANTWDCGHYVVAIGYDDRRIFVMDPYIVSSYGWLTWDDLDLRWHDHGHDGKMIRSAIEVFPRRNAKVPPPDFVPVK